MGAVVNNGLIASQRCCVRYRIGYFYVVRQRVVILQNCKDKLSALPGFISVSINLSTKHAFTRTMFIEHWQSAANPRVQNKIFLPQRASAMST